MPYLPNLNHESINAGNYCTIKSYVIITRMLGTYIGKTFPFSGKTFYIRTSVCDVCTARSYYIHEEKLFWSIGSVSE